MSGKKKSPGSPPQNDGHGRGTLHSSGCPGGAVEDLPKTRGKRAHPEKLRGIVYSMQILKNSLAIAINIEFPECYPDLLGALSELTENLERLEAGIKAIPPF